MEDKALLQLADEVITLQQELRDAEKKYNEKATKLKEKLSRKLEDTKKSVDLVTEHGTLQVTMRTPYTEINSKINIVELEKELGKQKFGRLFIKKEIIEPTELCRDLCLSQAMHDLLDETVCKKIQETVLLKGGGLSLTINKITPKNP